MNRPLAAPHIGDPGALEALYRRFLDDPHDVPRDWARYFAQLGEADPQVAAAPPGETGGDAADALRAVSLRGAWRRYGHLAARLDPLGLAEPPGHPALDPARHGLPPDDPRHQALREIYGGTTGFEIDHVGDAERRAWLFERAETPSAPDTATRQEILTILSRVEAFEGFMAKRFSTAKRFGIEGGDSFIVALETILAASLDHGISEAVMGGMHRGRLALTALVAGKPLLPLLAEVKGASPLPTSLDMAGDVPYHLGHSGTREIGGRSLHVSLSPHPSHLEVVGGVTLGRARAKQARLGLDAVLPLLVHTDASFAGQGVVAELMQMSGLDAYGVGGTIHVIVNNQLGFTTTPGEGRTARYCTDIARMIEAPVIHVNGDDPEAVWRAARLAADYRARFHGDILIDLVCYRRNGHNEIDEPRFTQPAMYQAIDDRKGVRTLYADRLAEAGIAHDAADAAGEALRAELAAAHEGIAHYEPNRADAFEGRWSGFALADEARMLEPVETGLALDDLHGVAEAITTPPEGFVLADKLTRFLAQRRESMTGEGAVNWAFAEALALASLAREGTPIRLGGQDTPRGAFTQRHLVLHDAGGRRHCILDGLGARAEVINSPLIEYAVLAFEYGYSLADPDPLVIWEAQFGDFLNVAQAVFDQFITCGEDRWLRSSGLVMLLPHGLDGGGPDHATGRPERLLAACAKGNIQVANPSTPANYFHCLRRQIHRPFRKPLAILSPKALLRHRAAVSPLRDFGPDTGFAPVIGDGEGAGRVLVCSGKIAFELEAERSRLGRDEEVAVIRLEQLYPFPEKALAKALAAHPQAGLVFVQEEPENMGPGRWLAPRLAALTPERPWRFVSRDAAATPAPGHPARDEAEKRHVLETAFA